MTSRIYLDNAATSWPKPPEVYQAVEHYLRNIGAAAGRGAYSEAMQVDANISTARLAVSQLINAENPQRIVFTFNCTDSLNIAIHGVLQSGDHVITSVVEHNSVLRPLRHLEETQQVEVTRIPCDGNGTINPAEIKQALQSNTKLIAITHASNVTGAIQPVAEIGKIAREANVLFLLDAAQSLGHIPLDVQALQVDLLAAAGHKGLLGPLGTGILYIREGLESQIMSFRQGGTGSVSDQDIQPEIMPDKFESGNPNVPGIVGLSEGVRFIQQRTVKEIQIHGEKLTQLLISGLQEIPGVTLYGPQDAQQQLSVVSFNIGDCDPRELAAIFDTSYQVQARAGIHCAPLMHKALGTLTLGGTLRFSPGIFTTEEEIKIALNAVAEVATAMM